LGYATAYRLLRAWWVVRRPQARGAAVAVWAKGRLLVVRCSYRPELDLPGGGLRRGEAPSCGALRELREETGITAPACELGPPLDLRFVQHRRRVTTAIFPWRPRHAPAPRIDHREIVWAGYLGPEELRARPLTSCLRAYLDRLEGDQPLSDVG
jgi:ADP-ribose pyrophosphatase YjhB (NUDIX family)